MLFLQLTNFKLNTVLLSVVLMTTLLLSSCIPGKFKLRMTDKKSATAIINPRGFKLDFSEEAASRVFCPRIHVIFAEQIPEGTSEYCLSNSNTDTSACEWKSLPFNFSVRATKNDSEIKKYLHFRNELKEAVDEVWSSNSLTVKKSVLKEDMTELTTYVKSSEVSNNEIEELLCRMDEWNVEVLLAIAHNHSESFDATRRLYMNQQLSRMYYDNFGAKPLASKAEISKVAWRAAVQTIDRSSGIANFSVKQKGVMKGYDVSFIDFTNRNINYFDFEGTNVKGSQLNKIDPDSFGMNFKNVDLKGWMLTLNSYQFMDLSGAHNIPWDYVNATIGNFAWSDFSRLDLKDWKPSASAVVNDMNFSDSINVPWSLLNSKSSLSKINLTNVDLNGFSPALTTTIGSINLTNAKNIPWSAINNNTSFSYNSGIIFGNLDLSNWNPSTSGNINSLTIDNCTNIPWTALNNNTHSNGYTSVKFYDIDLSKWNPPITSNISSIDYSRAKNIPWTQINANIHANYHSYSNFSGLDLQNWNPTNGAAIQGINYEGAKNIPWDKINNWTNQLGTKFTGLDLSKWNPSPSTNIQSVNLKDATNIPWTAINSNSLGIRGADLRNLDLSQWRPNANTSVRGINFVGSRNIPWSYLNANIHSEGFTATIFEEIDLASWSPIATADISNIRFSKAKNLPFTALNLNSHAMGWYGVELIKVDLKNWKPNPSASLEYTRLYGSRNINWNHLATHTHANGFNNTIFDGVDLSDFAPTTLNKRGNGYTKYFSFGNISLSDFKEATNNRSFPGMQWSDGTSYPWGP